LNDGNDRGITLGVSAIGRHNGAVSARRIHRVIGLMMLLPLVGWAVTGAIFFLKPGYAGAYESLAVKTYAFDRPLTLAPQPGAPQQGWLEVRYLETVLGGHVLARTSRGWQHLDSASLAPRSAPAPDEVRTLIQDALAANPSRYGGVVTIDGLTATTDTGVRVTLDWTRLALSQRGRDTDRIDFFYKVHYLQWTGVRSVDQVLGAVGLVLLVMLSALGAWIFARGSSPFR
jgi:hypothetical protein